MAGNAPWSDITDRVTRLEAFFNEWQIRHENKDDERFGSMDATLDHMSAKLDNLFEERARQVGAAKAIADLAEQRNKRNTFILALVVGIPSVLTLLGQHHWLGF